MQHIVMSTHLTNVILVLRNLVGTVTFGRFLLSVVKHRIVQLQFLVLKYLTSISFGPPSLLSHLRSDTSSPPEVRQGHGDRR